MVTKAEISTLENLIKEKYSLTKEEKTRLAELTPRVFSYKQAQGTSLKQAFGVAAPDVIAERSKKASAFLKSMSELERAEYDRFIKARADYMKHTQGVRKKKQLTKKDAYNTAQSAIAIIECIASPYYYLIYPEAIPYSEELIEYIRITTKGVLDVVSIILQQLCNEPGKAISGDAIPATPLKDYLSPQYPGVTLTANPLSKAFSALVTKAVQTNLYEPDLCEITTGSGSDKVTVKLRLFDKGRRNVTAYMLFDAIMYTVTNNHNGGAFCFSLKEYMDRRGLKDEKEARKQVKADLMLLHNASLSFKVTKGHNRGDYLDVHFFAAQGIIKGMIKGSCTEPFIKAMSAFRPMPYTLAGLGINAVKTPNAYPLFRYIHEYKNMNAGKPNENIISVKSLLKECPTLPSYEEVKAGNRMYTERIINRFETELWAAATPENLFSWEYCAAKEEFTEPPLSYEEFIKLYVKFTWNGYPDSAPRLQRLSANNQEKRAKISKAIAKKKADKNGATKLQ